MYQMQQPVNNAYQKQAAPSVDKYGPSVSAIANAMRSQAQKPAIPQNDLAMEQMYQGRPPAQDSEFVSMNPGNKGVNDWMRAGDDMSIQPQYDMAGAYGNAVGQLPQAAMQGAFQNANAQMPPQGGFQGSLGQIGASPQVRAIMDARKQANNQITPIRQPMRY
jgi:hypothetical protein